MAYCKYEDLTSLRDRSFDIATSPKYHGYERGLTSMVDYFFDKQSKGSGIGSMSNEQLVDELHEPIYVIGIFRKYAWFVPLKDQKRTTIVDAFQSLLNNSKRKPSKIW